MKNYKDKHALVVDGEVSPGFESIRQLFEKNLNSKSEESAQLCIYVKGEKVVDLWAHKKEITNFSPDSLINVWSSGKSLESLALASLVDKGLLNYENRISDYWPEFSQNAKGEITVADLMRHEAGLDSLNFTFRPDQLLPENIKENSVGDIIEKASSKRSSDQRYRRKYHALTRGWITNELFRRIDPNGRTIGEFLREDIAGPLQADVFVGVSDQQLPLIVKQKAFGIFSHILESLKPKAFGRRVKHNIFEIVVNVFLILKYAAVIFGHKINQLSFLKKKISASKKRNIGSRLPLADLKPLTHGYNTYNIITDGEYAKAESSSFNAKCSARGLAKVAAMLSAKGRFEDKEYLSKKTWFALHDDIKSANLGALGLSHFSQGGVHHFTLKGFKHSAIDLAINKGREDFFGWMGMGGSIFQWHPELDIGFAFVPSSLHLLDGFNERGKVYQQEIVRCVELMNNQKEKDHSRGNLHQVDAKQIA